MKTGILLEKLINIAQAPKIDFALSMNMAPSGLSKILTGKRLPFLKEKRMFSRQAAEYFAEALYGYNCYLKFDPVFPVIYNFHSKYELELFLSDALEYALDQDFAIENDENRDYPDKESGFLGKKKVLNMFCIIVSDYVVNHDDTPLEFYSTLPLFCRFYADIFRRVVIASPKKQNQISFNHFFNISSFEVSYDEYNMDVLLSIAQVQQYYDLNLWKIPEKMKQLFLLLKGNFLFVFNIQMDGTPFMSFITHKSYLAAFFNSLMKKDMKKISYNRSEAIAALEADPSFIDRLIHKKIDAVYNFISIGYLVSRQEMDAITDNEILKESILKLFHSIMTGEALFCVTVDAMMHFCATGKAIVPLLGAVDIPHTQRISYLQRFDDYITQENASKIKILNYELPNIAVLCFRGLSIVYVVDNEGRVEKMHYFETDMLNNILGMEIADRNMKTMEFSPDLWDTYMDELQKSMGWMKPKP